MASAVSKAQKTKQIDDRPLETFFTQVRKDAKGSSSATSAEVAEIIRRDRDAAT